MISAERKLVVTAAWALTVLGAWSIAQRAVQAEEVQPPRQVRVELKVTSPGIPVLSKLPFVGQLFVNNTKKEPECAKGECAKGECCKEAAKVADAFERIGVDFESASRELCVDSEGKLSCEKCAVELCPACPAVAQVAATAKVCCKNCTPENCAAVAACCKESQCVAQTVAIESQCEVDEELPCDILRKHPCLVSAEIADLRTENIALHSALEAKEQLVEMQTRMWERFAMLMAEKVQLQAQLEFSQQLLAERQKTLEKIQELAQENSRLKNMIEMATMREKVTQSNHELAQENQRLKTRVSELEVAGRVEQTEVRVAKKPRETKTEK
jgi:hypothetical protein